ncbi:MAG TPA: hypothetical protein P5123_12820 [Spirochaetota bacterium]|nr:hypothetical protein [Spirochaetota bacterium]
MKAVKLDISKKYYVLLYIDSAGNFDYETTEGQTPGDYYGMAADVTIPDNCAVSYKNSDTSVFTIVP